MTSEFKTLTFDELTLRELYEIIKLRLEVFVVEQDCVYQDIDGKDPDCLHVVSYNDKGDLLAYARLLPRGIGYPDYISVGRIITASSARSSGLGRRLVDYSISELNRLWPSEKIKIQAQSYLLKFYESYGFAPIGEEYLEDGIPHTDMVMKI